MVGKAHQTEGTAPAEAQRLGSVWPVQGRARDLEWLEDGACVKWWSWSERQGWRGWGLAGNDVAFQSLFIAPVEGELNPCQTNAGTISRVLTVCFVQLSPFQVLSWEVPSPYPGICLDLCSRPDGTLRIWESPARLHARPQAQCQAWGGEHMCPWVSSLVGRASSHRPVLWSTPPCHPPPREPSPPLALLLVPSLSLGSTFAVYLHPKNPVNATPVQSTSCGPHLSTCSCPTGQPCHLSGASRANCTLSCNQLVSGLWETWVFQSQAGGQSVKPSWFAESAWSQNEVISRKKKLRQLTARVVTIKHEHMAIHNSIINKKILRNKFNKWRARLVCWTLWNMAEIN